MPSFDRLHITVDPMIRGVLFITWGRKRDYRLYRLRNGVSILVDPVSYAPIGFSVFQESLQEAVTALPLAGSVAFLRE